MLHKHHVFVTVRIKVSEHYLMLNFFIYSTDITAQCNYWMNHWMIAQCNYWMNNWMIAQCNYWTNNWMIFKQAWSNAKLNSVSEHFLYITIYNSQDKAVSIPTRLLYTLGFKSWQMQSISSCLNNPDQLSGPPRLPSNSQLELFLWVQSGQRESITTVPCSSMSRSLSVLALYTFMVCTGTSLHNIVGLINLSGLKNHFHMKNTLYKVNLLTALM
jgi:hypothetical protein